MYINKPSATKIFIHRPRFDFLVTGFLPTEYSRSSKETVQVKNYTYFTVICMVFLSPFSFLVEIFRQMRGTVDTQDMLDAFVKTVEDVFLRLRCPDLGPLKCLDKA